MREIRRRNPHIKTTDGMGALDDVNEQELAKDGVSTPMPQARQEKNTEASPQDKTADSGENAALPLMVEKKQEQVVVPSEREQTKTESEPEQAPPAPEQEEVEEQEHEPKERRTGGLYVAFIALCALLSVAVILYAAFGRPTEQVPEVQQPDQSTQTDASNTPPVDPRSFYDRIASCAVTVRTSTDDGTKISSGTVVFSDGYVATLWDTVERAEKIEVILKSGESYGATLIGGSALSELALLKIGATELEALNVGQSVSIGETVYAVGAMGSSASASLSSSLCSGSVSFGTRSLRVSDGDTQKFIKAIQLDGFNSDALGGCPVFNEDGAAIAIMVNIGTDAASFALPIGEAMSVLSSIKAGEELTDEAVAALAYPCPRLGVECEAANGGVKIAAFSSSESDAAKKLRIGDVIVKVGEATVTDTEELRAQIEKHRVGEAVEIFVQRYGQILSFYVGLSL